MLNVRTVVFCAIIAIAAGRVFHETDGMSKKEPDLHKLLAKLHEQGKLDLEVHKHTGENDALAHHLHHDEPSTTNIQTFNVYYKKRSNDDSTVDSDRMCTKQKCASKECASCNNLRSDYKDSVDQVAEMLDLLEGELGIKPVDDMHGMATRCSCSDGDGLRCSCSSPDRKDETIDDVLRCRGDRCGGNRDGSDEKRDDEDRKDRSNSLRCQGDRCGRDRDREDGPDIIEDRLGDFRCVGNRCGRQRADKEGEDNERDSLRCKGDRCGKDRDIMDLVRQGKSPDDIREERREDDDKDMFSLRCKGNRCGYIRHDRDADTEMRDRDGLRCRGNRCGRSDKKLRCRGPQCEEEFQNNHNLNDHVKKFRINDNLDAMVMDISDLDQLLTKLGTPTTSAKLLDMDYFNSFNVNQLLGKQQDEKLKAIVIDLSKIEDSASLAKRIEELIHSKTNNLLERITNENDFDNDMNRASDLFTGNQKRVLEVKKLGTSDKQVKTGASKIVAKNNSVPKWLQQALLKVELRERDINMVDKVKADGIMSSPKSLFPLTIKQRNRLIQKLNKKKDQQRPLSIWRRNEENDVGFPFDLQVQGLGQIDPGNL